MKLLFSFYKKVLSITFIEVKIGLLAEKLFPKMINLKFLVRYFKELNFIFPNYTFIDK